MLIETRASHTREIYNTMMLDEYQDFNNFIGTGDCDDSIYW